MSRMYKKTSLVTSEVFLKKNSKLSIKEILFIWIDQLISNTNNEELLSLFSLYFIGFMF
jgi:hypothetical protein